MSHLKAGEGKLLPGDVVLADRGFDTQESVGMMCAEVKTPAYTRGRRQLPAVEIESTRKLAYLRIRTKSVLLVLLHQK